MCLLFIHSNSNGQSENESAVAIIQSYSGSVQITRGSNNIAGSRGVTLNSGDIIKTEVNSSAIIMFKNAIRISLKSSSRISLNSSSGEDNNKYSITQFDGTVISKVISLASGASYEVNTPSTNAGVRGTDFTTLVGVDGSTGLIVEEGIVALVKSLREQNTPTGEIDNQQETQDEETVTVSAGQQAEVTQESEQIQTSQVTNAEEARNKWQNRRVEFFKNNYPRVFKVLSFRLARIKKNLERSIQWIDFVENRMKSNSNRIDNALKSRIPRAKIIIRQRVKRISMISFRTIRRLHIISHRINAIKHVIDNLEAKLPGHKAVKSKEFLKIKETANELYDTMHSKRDEIRQKLSYIISTNKKWRRMLR